MIVRFESQGMLLCVQYILILIFVGIDIVHIVVGISIVRFESEGMLISVQCISIPALAVIDIANFGVGFNALRLYGSGSDLPEMEQ